jgi:hypothetical protein
MKEFPHLQQWIDRIWERPAVKRGTGDFYNTEKNPSIFFKGS